MYKLNFDRASLKKFGLTMATAFFAITLLILFRHKHSPAATSALSFVFFVLGLIAPQSLKYVYILWMKLAFVLGWVNTRLILLAIFYLIFMPIGLLMRVFGKDLLDRKIERRKGSYWRKRENKAFNQADYERQF